MAIEIRLPALSPTMEKATLARWLVREGDDVKVGDLLAEIETEKATMELEAEEGGRIGSLLVAGGSEDVPVGTVIALLGDCSGGEAASSGKDASVPRPVPGPASQIDDAPSPFAKALKSVAAQPEIGNPAGLKSDEVLPPVISPSALTSENAGILATPLARRIAAMRHIALDGIRGTGARGKIVKADLGLARRLVAPTPHSDAPDLITTETLPLPAGVPFETVKLSTMRKTIARRLSQSKQTVPHFYLTSRCRLDPLLAFRAEINSALAGRGLKVTVNDLLMKAMALAMRDVPEVNVQFGGGELHRFGRVDIAMAVAIDGGLITPVITNVAGSSLASIAARSQALARRAREGKLAPEDYQGGTASISNLGMFGVDEIVPVINPPHSLILGLGAGVEQPWKVEGAIGLATIIAATASFDHRAIDGAQGARFMAAFREYVEAPLLIAA